MDRYTNVHTKTIDRYTHRKTEINIHTCIHTIMNIILVNCNVLEITGDHWKMPGEWGYSPLPDPRKYVSVCALQDGLFVLCKLAQGESFPTGATVLYPMI